MMIRCDKLLSTVLLFVTTQLIAVTSLFTAVASQQKIHALYSSLDERSLSQLLTFCQLFPHSDMGKRCLDSVRQLLAGGGEIISESELKRALPGLVEMVNGHFKNSPREFDESAVDLIEKVAQNLPNRKLKGYRLSSEKAVWELPPEEIDVARSVLLAQLGETAAALKQVRSYEALLDLMALQISAKLSSSPTSAEKIRAINQFLFFDVGYRFPPHALYSKEIDRFTYLPSLMEARRGVCLGVSLLYISLGQRLNLPLELVTPPGHIFVRYCPQDGAPINIETTARGVHLDDDEYVTIDNYPLRQRSYKEAIGLALFNEGSLYLCKEQYSKALDCYAHAEKYLPGDLQLKEVMGYCCLLSDQRKRGVAMLSDVVGQGDKFNSSGKVLAREVLFGEVDQASLKALLGPEAENRQQLLSKLRLLQASESSCPRSKSVHMALASIWLELHRFGEALEAFEQCHRIDPNDPEVEYYLAVLYCKRCDYPLAWTHLQRAEKLCRSYDRFPRPLRELRRNLSCCMASPSPLEESSPPCRI